MNAPFVSSDADLLARFRHSWIGGRERPGEGAEIAHVDPATGAPRDATDDAGLQAVEEAVAAGRAAFAGAWGAMPAAERGRRILAWAEKIAQATEALARLETLEVGRPIRDARAVIAQGPGLVAHYIDMIARLEDRGEGAARRPRGVVAAITPWNFPVANVLVRAAPILAAGNCLVVKPSELSPRSAVLLAALATEAGIPDGVFNVVLGSGATVGAALAAHRGIDMVAFTGSTATGRAIVRASAEARLKPVSLECGGKSAQIILEDMIDRPEIWPTVFFSAFWNSGQWCAARTRLLVPRGRLADAVEGLGAAARQWRMGDPRDEGTTLGPLASRRQYEVVTAYRGLAREAGEVVDLPCAEGDYDPRGFYVRPEIVLDPAQDARIVQEEVFGPILCLQQFSNVGEARRLADGTDYGLAATVWTADRDAAERLAAGLEVGSVAIMTTPAAQAGLGTGVFEPRKQSGFGADGGFQGLAAYTAPQAVRYHA